MVKSASRLDVNARRLFQIVRYSRKCDNIVNFECLDPGIHYSCVARVDNKMAQHFLSQKSRRLLIASCISLIAAIFLVRAVDWQESIKIFRAGVSPRPLFIFAIMAFAIILIYGYRWRLLLDRQIQHKTSLVASTLCLGGNMFLPARGGDLLRVHYSHIDTAL